MLLFLPLFLGPLFLVSPPVDNSEGPTFPFAAFRVIGIVMPLIQVVLTYIAVVIGCWAYNLLAPRIGGLEFEVDLEQVERAA